MIRRGFWLAAGAVLGVTGYRRVTRLARGLTGSPGGTLAVGPTSGRARPSAAGTAPDGPVAHAAPGYRARPIAGQPRGTFARILVAVGFIRDVRAGMAEYLDRHHQELARTLGSRSGRVSSG